MSQDDKWGRQRGYLIRSLFKDVEIPSSITEEGESIDFSQDGSTSPLPSLIIEKEHNRHDEPEEYYIELAVKMKKIYRKLNKKNRDDVSTETSDYSDDFDTGRRKSIDLEDLEDDTMNSAWKRSEDFDNYLDELLAQMDVHSSNETNKSDEGLVSNESVAQLELERDTASESECDISEDVKSANGSSASKKTKTVSDVSDHNGKENENSDVDDSTIGSNHDHRLVIVSADVHREPSDDEIMSPRLENVEDPEIVEVEVIRTPRLVPTRGSLQHDVPHDTSNEDLLQMNTQSLEYVTEHSSTNRESVSMELESIDLVLQTTSSPDIGIVGEKADQGYPKDNLENFDNVGIDRRKRITMSPVASSKRPRYENRGLQTSAEQRERKSPWLRDIFMERTSNPEQRKSISLIQQIAADDRRKNKSYGSSASKKTETDVSDQNSRENENSDHNDSTIRSNDHRLVKDSANVHRDPSDDNDSTIGSNDHRLVKDSANVHRDPSDDKISPRLENVEDPEIDEVEVMRTPRLVPTRGSHQHDVHHCSNEDLLEINTRSTERVTEYSSTNREPVSVELESIDFVLHTTANPVRGQVGEDQENNENLENVDNESINRRKRRTMSGVARSKRPRYEDRGTQTSVEQRQSDSPWLRDLFVGTPIVYNLCGCPTSSPCDRDTNLTLT